MQFLRRRTNRCESKKSVIEWLKARIGGFRCLIVEKYGQRRRGKDLGLFGTILITTLHIRQEGGNYLCPYRSASQEKLAAGIDEEHEIEEWYGDMSSLLRYMEGKRGDHGCQLVTISCSVSGEVSYSVLATLFICALGIFMPFMGSFLSFIWAVPWSIDSQIRSSGGIIKCVYYYGRPGIFGKPPVGCGHGINWAAWACTRIHA